MNCRVCGTSLPDEAIFCGECGSSVTAARVRRPAVADRGPSDTRIIDPLPAHRAPDALRPTSGEPSAPHAGRRGLGMQASFTLRFSSGESVVISGRGILGRRPVAQPDETFDQVVSILDPDKSVSKTHLEFGQEAGELWICDRYSANGTMIVPSGGNARYCEPGRRYRVRRGTQVQLAGQSFLVV